MLIEHTKPCSRFIGTVHLIPGFNQVEDKLWDEMTKKGSIWEKPIKDLIDQEVIKVSDPRTKPNVKTVEKTYNVELLAEWLVDAKGPLKAAIKKQIAAMEVEKDL